MGSDEAAAGARDPGAVLDVGRDVDPGVDPNTAPDVAPGVDLGVAQASDGREAAPARAEAILTFWFTDEPDEGAVAARQDKLWWGSDQAVDLHLRDHFNADVERALRGELADWADTARGRLALILLFDQMPRCIHRGTPASFVGDAQALALCREGIARGHDRQLRPIERVFFYMPLEHAEELAAQEAAVQCFRALVDEADPRQKELFTYFGEFAARHHTIIARFGRFPHRNAILGRAPTPQEIAFLQEPGATF